MDEIDERENVTDWEVYCTINLASNSSERILSEFGNVQIEQILWCWCKNSCMYVMCVWKYAERYEFQGRKSY